jgi:serine protease Do
MEENNNNFEVISSRTSNANFNQNQKQNNFGKTVLIPFASGVVGCSLVLGTCFGIPSIKEKLIGNQTSTVQTSTQTASGTTTNLVSLSNFSNTAVFAANKILPSIVGIEVSYSVASNSIGSFFGYSQPQTSTATATGSGIIISEDGYIVTNNHVVDSSSSNSYYELSKATSIKIKLNSDTYGDDATYDATVVGQDSQTDLAVLKIEKTGLTAAEFADSDQAVVGEFVMAVGSPLGLDTTVTQGIISAVNREVESDGTKYTCIQTDAAINSGNSGGALINSDGKVIGINTLKLSGTGVEGIGFAIPINSATDVISQLKAHQKVLRPYIGITGINLDEQTAKKYKLEVGVYIKSVEDFSPAEKAGLKAGDVIIKADGKSITTKDELNEIKNSHQIGDTMTLTVNRNGSDKDISVTLEETP